MRTDHRDALEARIEAARDRAFRLSMEIDTKQKQLAELMAQSEPDEESADRVQRERDECARTRERLELQIAAFEAKLPEASRADAQIRLDELAPIATRERDKGTKLVERIEAAIDELAAAVDDLEPAVRSFWALRKEIGKLALDHGIEADCSAARVPEPGLVKRLRETSSRFTEAQSLAGRIASSLY